jgi:hypothetical protein
MGDLFFYEIHDFSILNFDTKNIQDLPLWCYKFIKSQEENIMGWQLT